VRPATRPATRAGATPALDVLDISPISRLISPISPGATPALDVLDAHLAASGRSYLAGAEDEV
jgi:hypothetical protein